MYIKDRHFEFVQKASMNLEGVITALQNIKDIKSIFILKSILDEQHSSLLRIKYQHGKIYEIVHIITKDLAYIGSTIQELPCRFGGHKNFVIYHPDSKYSTYIKNHGGFEMFEIRLLEEFPCESREALVQREMSFIQSQSPPCNTIISASEKPILNLDETNLDMINDRTCPKCGLVLACKAKLDIHLERKIPCDIGKHKCERCPYRTNDSSNMSKHRKTCKGTKKSAYALDMENAALREINAELKQQLDDVLERVLN